MPPQLLQAITGLSRCTPSHEYLLSPPMFRLCLLQLLSILLFSSLLLQAQDEVILPEITREGGVKTRAVAVQSPDQQLLGLLRQAFNVHGAYTLSSGDRAEFTIQLTPADNRTVTLIISSGSPSRELFRQRISGSNQRQAALRAIDLAVAKTTGLRGFFAGTLAFLSDRTGKPEIYVSDLFFGNIRQITRDNAICQNPQMSPDGSKLLYTTYFSKGFPDIYEINLNTRQRRALISFKGTNTGATYSPDGREIAMVLSGTGNPEIYVSNAQARNMRRISYTSSLESDPAWSPDGRQLVFASDRSLGKPQIYTVSSSGGSARRLPTNISGYCAEPDWNPANPNQIIFTIAQAGQFEIALYDSETGRSTVLSSGPGDAVEPVWMRDGRHIIYTERTTRYRKLVILDSETRVKSELYRSSWGDTYQADFIYPFGN